MMIQEMILQGLTTQGNQIIHPNDDGTGNWCKDLVGIIDVSTWKLEGRLGRPFAFPAVSPFVTFDSSTVLGEKRTTIETVKIQKHITKNPLESDIELDELSFSLKPVSKSRIKVVIKRVEKGKLHILNAEEI